MNSEELETSLKTEFESYLKGFIADLRQEVSEFQKNFETEFEKHRSQTDEAIRKLVQRFEKDVEFGEAFNESVIEHLRLARDEGATITAIAIGEAEKLQQKEAAPVADLDKLRDAVNEISSKSTQSEILKALVDSAGNYTPRGAFFIVKNDQFVGWRAFGSECEVDEDVVQSIKFPVSADTVLADAVESLATKASSANENSENSVFLDALGFGSPDRMYAVPLIARGRGVAVLYADFGHEGLSVNPDGLEMLVRVAGLTVELAAAGVQPSPPPQKVETPVVTESEVTSPEYEAPPEEETAFTEPAPADDLEDRQEAQADEAPYHQFDESESASEDQFESTVESQFVEESKFVAPAAEQAAEEVQVEEESFEAVVVDRFEPVAEYVDEVASDDSSEATTQEFIREESFVQYTEEVTYFEPIEEPSEHEYAVDEPSFDTTPAPSEATEFPEVIEEAVEERAPEPESEPEPAQSSLNGSAAPQVSEPLAEVANAQAARLRYRDRNIDLPIEVPEEERRLHNDARRFARLLVSEIKLYNEQKVTDGREAGDLYDRLREAIDRSREMYDKRVQPPVAEKFDYFHYELVSSLAEGDDVKLGASYPGSKVHA